MPRVLLSKAAALDLEAIDERTIESFGLEQARRTAERFREALRSLAAMPLSAPLREDYSPPGRLFRYRTVLGAFVIVYEPLSDGIRVARVLHGAQDLAVALERDAGGE